MYFVKETLTTFPYLTLPVSRYWAKVGGISDFRISGQSFINENCHNSGSSHDINTKLGPVTELDKRNMANLEKFDEDASRRIVTSLSLTSASYGMPYTGHMTYKIYIYIKDNLFPYKK